MNNQISPDYCGYCREIMESPVNLPCGESICKKHTIRGNSVLCPTCKIDHPKPAGHNEFPPNRPLSRIIESKLAGIRDLFGEDLKGANEYCKRFDQLLNNIEPILHDPFNFTYEAIKSLKDVVQLRGEEMKLEIDTKMSCLIKKLDEYNTSCKMNLETKDYLDKLNKIQVEREDDRQKLEKWVKELRLNKLNENGEWARVKSESKHAIERFQVTLELFKHDLLLRQFEQHRREVEEFSGEFKIDEIFNLG